MGLSEGVVGTGGGKKTAGEGVAVKKKSKAKRKGAKVAVVVVVDKGVVHGGEANGAVAAAEPKTEKQDLANATKFDSTAEVQHDAGGEKDADTMDTKKNPIIHQNPGNKNSKNDTRPLKYRADAGGSLRLPRQRFKKKAAARGSVRDLFGDQDQDKAMQE